MFLIERCGEEWMWACDTQRKREWGRRSDQPPGIIDRKIQIERISYESLLLK